MEELANLVSTKDKAIKNTKRGLLKAKKVTADLKAVSEVQSLRSRNNLKESDYQQQTSQQQSGRETLIVFPIFTVGTRRSFR